ncbi:sigma-54-dependent Fis family transcriptional regulator [Roseovarius pelagicus]|uniref:Sigma 54-interacting transcriptional regulator n=1 Tax=Roseovarius pelagicus TaxID=2980108 RepID=A0ABY6D8D0_9RHOB|nr:helix-turn-helix domain-containing protein [Roseovarius pelagicus]UXX82376.1 sigma 54-interacting transcriptional regulator [Roseovarius pelagicus]
MTDALTLRIREEIAASWDRCERQHKLARDAVRPIMRLQSSEIAPRLQQITARTGGRQGFFRQLASSVGDGKRCLVVTDADGVLVRLESAGGQETEDWNGIALGSCWDERIAGTNGVSMALRAGRAFTVGGADHFYQRLRAFACTGTPIFDAMGALVGSVNLVTYDHGTPAEHLITQQYLATAADRIQRRLFEQHFSDSLLVTVSSSAPGRPLSGDGLVAVDESGIILGATSAVNRLFQHDARNTLKGQPFQAVFNMESDALAKVPERVLSMPKPEGAVVSFSARMPGTARSLHPGATIRTPARRGRRLPPSLRDLATGCKIMAARCAEARTLFQAGTSLVIEGETSTGKSALIAALAGDAPLLRVDCTTLRDDAADAGALRSVLTQARVLAMMPEATNDRPTVVFDNIHEMPVAAQSVLRGLLESIESDAASGDAQTPRLVSVSRRPLMHRVAQGRFRDDLYYMLAGAHVSLPPLRERERPEILAEVLATRIAGRRITLSEAAVTLIKAHTFPGNLRELRTALERALITMAGDQITPVDLSPTSIRMAEHVPALSDTLAPALAYDDGARVRDALTSSGWNVTEAARRLGISRATINRKIKRYGFMRPA